MYSVIIVDDEEILREGLVNLVDWKTMGFEVAGQFEDGQDAVEFLKRCPVDVVLTDVKMTYMSGLDLSEYIVENRLPAKIVLISGYKEFDDAYRAVQLNITEFLLKPVSLDDIRQVFSRVRCLLDEERERSQKQQKMAQKLDRLVAYTTKQFVTNLALGGYRTEEEIARSLETLGLPLAGRRCAMVSIVLEGFHLFNQNEWEYGEDALYTAVCNFLQLDAEALSFYPSYGMDGRIQALAVYHMEGDEAEFLETFRRQGEKIAADIREMLGLQGRRPLPGASGNPAQQLSALVDVVKLGARENGKVEAVDAQGIALAGIMGLLLRRAVRIVPVVFQHNSLGGPKPIAHHAAQSRGRPRAVGQCDRFVQKRRSQAQPSLGKQGERNDGYLGLHERPRLGKHLLRRRSGHLHARQTLCTGGKSRKAPR